MIKWSKCPFEITKQIAEDDAAVAIGNFGKRRDRSIAQESLEAENNLATDAPSATRNVDFSSEGEEDDISGEFLRRKTAKREKVQRIIHTTSRQMDLGG